MRLRLNQLQQHLQKGDFLPLYIVSGDEPLLSQESGDLIRTQLRQAGFTERESYQVGTGFDWGTIIEAANSLSLFGDRKLIEVRFPTAKIDDKGKKALTEYLAHKNTDTVLVLFFPKVDKRFTSTKWFQSIENEGALLQIWPIEGNQLSQWVHQRMMQAGLQPSPDAVALMVERVEGNLLAAAQEIEKLTLLVEPGPIDANTVQNVVSDQARYNLFDLVDEALKGNLSHALKMLNFLKATGTEPTIILWALAKELRTLESIANSVDQGIPAAKAFKDLRVWDNRKPILQAALQKHTCAAFKNAIIEAGRIDHGIKGIQTYDPWTGFRNILLMLSGRDISAFQPTH